MLAESVNKNTCFIRNMNTLLVDLATANLSVFVLARKKFEKRPSNASVRRNDSSFFTSRCQYSIRPHLGQSNMCKIVETASQNTCCCCCFCCQRQCQHQCCRQVNMSSLCLDIQGPKQREAHPWLNAAE